MTRSRCAVTTRQQYLGSLDEGEEERTTRLLMRVLGRLDIKRGWNHTAKNTPGVRNTLAGCISRWPRVILADKVRKLTNSDDGSEQDIGTRVMGLSIPYYRQRTFSASMPIARGID